MTRESLAAFGRELAKAESTMKNSFVKVTGITIEIPGSYPYQIQGDLSKIIGIPEAEFKTFVLLARQAYEENIQKSAENVATVHNLAPK